MTKPSKKFKYKPLSLKDIIREMKQNIDLMIDLAYSALKFGSKELADEVYNIEQRNHELTFLLNFQIIQAHPRGLQGAKKLEPIVYLGYAIDKISDALSDIARVVYINNDISYFVQLFSDISYVPEPIVKIVINEGCSFIGQIRKDVHFRSKHGVDLIAIKRGNKWLFEKNERVLAGDILIVKGEIQPITELKSKCVDKEPFSFDLEKQKEKLMDGLNIAFEKDLLDLAQLLNSPRDLTGVMRIIFSCEIISDSAAHIAENILKGFEPHKIFQQAIHETSEIVVRETLSEDSYFKGKTYSELQDSRYKRGFHIIALKREDKWIYIFKPDFIFEQGDLLIGLGPEETVLQWRKCVNPEKYNE
jgi:uncharacterized protein with PhoU and TrkA domain